MNNHGSFGRRNLGARPSAAARVIEENTRARSPQRYVEQPVLLTEKPEFTLDDDLREWKRARKPNFDNLWRPLLLMATVCFGIASFVLPDSVNDAVDWLLYAMMGATLYSWIRKRRRANI